MNTLATTATPIASPHAHGGAGVSVVMLKVMAALAPATLYGFWLYGWPAIHLWFITVFAALLVATLVVAALVVAAESKRAEEALRRSEERYRRLFDEDLSGDFIATPDGKVIECPECHYIHMARR